MDPSIILCKYQSSFLKNGEVPSVLQTYNTADQNTSSDVEKRPDSRSDLVLEDKKYCDADLNDRWKYQLPPGKLNVYDPFHDVSTKPFLNRDAIVLANIDAVFNFTNHRGGYILKQDMKDLTFATIEDGPGGFTQYMLYRSPNSYGFGISSVPFDKSIDWSHFNVINNNLVNETREVEPSGIDVVLGNYNNSAGLDIGPNGYMSRLLTALRLVKVGGNFICKIRNISDPLLVDLLYITSQCFDKTTLFKPLSSPFVMSDNVYYVVAEKAKANNTEWIDYLNINLGKNLRSLLAGVPEDFERWVTEYNNLMLLYNQYLFKVTDNKIYDTYKCKAIWNLPKL